MSNFLQQIQKEAKRSPKKAVLLGVLAVAAIYFCLPLVFGSSTKTAKKSKSGSMPNNASAAPTAVAESSPAVPVFVKAEKATFDGELATRGIDADPLCKPAEKLATTRDPFRISTTPSQIETTKKLVSEPKKKFTSPDSLGLKLTGTLVGPKSGLAQINGKTYSQGQVIAASKEGQDYQMTLKAIYSNSVSLTMDGKDYLLRMPTSNSAGKIDLVKEQ